MKTIKKICIWLGAALLIATAIALIGWIWNVHSWAQKSADYAQTISAQIPAPQDAALEERTNNAMPLLSIEGTDFVGILEMPRFGSALPVGANWGKVSHYPCRFDGSAYDRTLQLGATTQKGQYDFYREISVGDSISFTDMEGNRYQYAVADIRYESHADQAALTKKDADLTLFIKNIYASEYIILFCDALG